MFVLEEFRNQKVGSRLVESFLQWAKSKGADNIMVIASALNDKAINFYKKLGFKNYDVHLELTF